MDTPHKYRKGFRRDAEMLSEAYSGVYNEGVNYSDTSGGGARRAAANRKQLRKTGAVRLQSPEGTSRATLPKDDPKIEELKKQGYTEIPIEDEEGSWMERDWKSREDRPDGEHHDKFTSIAQDGLQQMLDQLHVGGHGEDMDMNELRLGYEQLSRGLNGLLGEFDAGEILGGAAQAQAEAGSEPEQFTSMEFPSDEEY